MIFIHLVLYEESSETLYATSHIKNVIMHVLKTLFKRHTLSTYNVEGNKLGFTSNSVFIKDCCLKLDLMEALCKNYLFCKTYFKLHTYENSKLEYSIQPKLT